MSKIFQTNAFFDVNFVNPDLNKAYFGVQSLLKILKENLEKKKPAVFRKRFSAKTAGFSVFKSVSR